jgi:hypothetical protein
MNWQQLKSPDALRVSGDFCWSTAILAVGRSVILREEVGNPAAETPACPTGQKPVLLSSSTPAEDSSEEPASDLSAELAARGAHGALRH